MQGDHTTEPGLVIIGAGFAGYQTAKQWRLQDKQTNLTIITQHLGAVYSKPQLSTLQSKGKHPETLITHTAEQMAQTLNAKIITQAQVVHLDRAKKIVVLDSGQVIAYQQCVFATGAVVNQLPLPKEQQDLMVSVNHWEDYLVLHKAIEKKADKHVIVIGSGLVGCELANDFIIAGFRVTVISNDAYPMSRLMPQALGDVFQKRCEQAGIIFKMNTQVKKLEKENDQIKLFTQHETLVADVIVSAIGFSPQVTVAKQAGLTIDHGIVVNALFQTNDEFIYAIGDCAVRDNHWRPYIAPILNGAKILADVLAHKVPLNLDFPVMPVVVKTPLCPVQGVFDHPEKMKHYRVEIDPSCLKCFYYNKHNALKAFVLLGDATAERQQWVEKLAKE
jgi:rubredoxin-NAD+ reductase